MEIKTRKLLDKSFTGIAYMSLAAMCVSLAVFLLPIIYKGSGAFIFNATVEHDKFLRENTDSAPSGYAETLKRSEAARAPLYRMMGAYENPDAAKGLEDRLDALVAKPLERLLSGDAEIPAILAEKDAAARLAKARKLAEILSAEYAAELPKLAETSMRDGSGFALRDALSKRREAIPDAIKAALDRLREKTPMGVMQRAFLRRNLSEPFVEATESAIKSLEESSEAYETFKKGVRELLGPENAAQKDAANLMRQKYGQPRMDQARDVLANSVLKINVKARDDKGAEMIMRADTLEYFKGTPVEKMALEIRDNFEAMMQPHWTLYAGFFFDDPYDSNIFGGIWPMILGTFYLTAGSMIIAAPLGIIAAVYFSEYAGKSAAVSVLRMCVGTLAGVPSIVFGLFGLAFLINTLKVSESKSVLAGSLTLALLVLPTIIRSCEEALKSVPNSYREASLGLGAGKWKSITGVILPAALPGMLTGIIISMGRAAGETAPIIFTAATSTGAALAVWEVFTQATPALPWNIYNMCSEHEMADKVVHVQYGMVLTLIGIVLALNLAAILIRARLQKKLKN